MIKLVKNLLLCCTLPFFISACAQGLSPVNGLIFTEVAGPLTASSASGAKKGSARCTSILGAVATGNCSIEAAKQNGGITSVASVDYRTRSILGLFAEVTVEVTGS